MQFECELCGQLKGLVSSHKKTELCEWSMLGIHSWKRITKNKWYQCDYCHTMTRDGDKTKEFSKCLVADTGMHYWGQV